MKALQIVSMKQFMNHLLVSDTFDLFLLEEAAISTGNTYTINGRCNRSFYSEEELEGTDLCKYEFTPWKDLKGLCFQLIKGKHTPLSFKMVMQLIPEKTAALLVKEGCTLDPAQVKALVLTIKYDGTKAVLTTGSAYHTFLLNKEPDLIWDNAFKKYLMQKGISYEEL